MGELSFVLKSLTKLLQGQGRRWTDSILVPTDTHRQVLDFLLMEYGSDSLKLTEYGWSTQAAMLVALKSRLERLGVVAPSDPEPVTVEVKVAAAETTPSSDDAPPPGFSRFAKHRLVASEDFLDRPAETNGRDKARDTVLARLHRFPDRYLPKASKHHLKQLPVLRRDFPNFVEVLDHVEMQLHLLVLEREAVHVEPLLLVGAPGVGKTEFARRLAVALRLTFSSEDLAACTSSFVLTGSSASWASAQQGVVSKAAVNLKPGFGALLLLDELDKAAGDHKFPVAPALLNLLEPSTAERFTDEYLGVPLNVRRVVSFMATANDLSMVDAPLLSRLRVFKVPMPDAQQMRAVVRSLDASLRQQRPGLRRHFAPLPAEAVEAMSVMPPRTLRQVLLSAYAAAAARRERTLQPHDLEAAARQRMPPRKPAVGFVP